MKLKTLEVTLNASYDDNPGKYTAAVEYEGERGNVKLVLDAKVSEALLAFIGPTITKFTHQSALQLEKSIEQSVIEAQNAPTLEIASTAEA